MAVDNVEVTFLQITQSLARLETRQAELIRTLLGNGQPGVIAKMEANIEELQSSYRTGRGVVATLAVLFSGMAAYLLKFR